MSDTKKIPIKRLYQMFDYGLWKINVEAACNAKGVNNTLSNPAAGATVSDTYKQTSSVIIFPALSDSAPQIVRTVIGDPVKMSEKHDVRLNSQSTATNIGRLSS